MFEVGALKHAQRKKDRTRKHIIKGLENVLKGKMRLDLLRKR
jgi:hypothetical protein